GEGRIHQHPEPKGGQGAGNRTRRALETRPGLGGDAWGGEKSATRLKKAWAGQSADKAPLVSASRRAIDALVLPTASLASPRFPKAALRVSARESGMSPPIVA